MFSKLMEYGVVWSSYTFLALVLSRVAVNFKMAFGSSSIWSPQVSSSHRR
jgi:hypothetical protein